MDHRKLPAVTFGKYWIGRQIAAGARGSVYYASDEGDLEKPNAAAKHPATNRELRTIRALHDGPSLCLGVPALLDFGKYGDRDKPYVVMELLGVPLHAIFKKMNFLDLASKWRMTCVMGRLLLRRLHAIHDRGFVHCDIQPSNVLIGRRLGTSLERYMPFFVDFGLAHPHPGGDPIQPHAGTIEYNSIRSSDGGPRLPRDDVEALGWMLLHGFLGSLPWFEAIQAVSWNDKPRRAVMVKQVQQMKVDALSSGGGSLQNTNPFLPKEMIKYMLLCRSFGGDADEGDAARPDYAALARLLGDAAPAAADVGPEIDSDKEKEDLLLLSKAMARLGL